MKPLRQHVWAFFLIGLLTSAAVQAETRMKGPFNNTNQSYRPPNYQTSAVKLVWINTINLYSKYISPADGPRSPSYPTSTAYGKQAIEAHGFLLGIILIADRLIHESDQHLGPKIIIHGNRRYHDPVEANTYWWGKN